MDASPHFDLHAAVLAGLRAPRQGAQDATAEGSGEPRARPRLWPSEIGGCPRAAMLRVGGAPRAAGASDTLLEAAHLGTWMEAATHDALSRLWPGQVTRGERVGDAIWSGKLDFLVTLPRQEPLLVEHKVIANPQYWNYHGTLPKRAHVLQALLYQDLYAAAHDRLVPSVALYYVAWGHSATFHLSDAGDKVLAHGVLDGEAWGPRALSLNLTRTRAEFEVPYTSGLLPSRRACSDGAGCTFRGAPSCPYFAVCWEGG